MENEMNETVTKRDLVEQKIDKVFPEGPTEAEPEPHTMAEIMARPGGGITAADLDAAKALAMAGPLVPEFVRGNPGTMLAAMMISRRFAKYDARTNSWITFDPIAVAQCMYLVESGGKQSVGYTSQFVGAVLEGFVPWASRMRYRYEGEGEGRTCTASALLKGDPTPFEYTTPPLRLITPKKSPLWQSDPDRQLAYFARRAWARLYVPGVLLGIYDVDELEGDARQYRGSEQAKAVEGSAALHQRLLTHAEGNGDREPEGYHPDAVERGMREEVAGEDAPRSAKGRGRVSRGQGRAGKAKAGKRKAEARRPPGKPKTVAPAPKEELAPAALPTNTKEYRRWVEGWLGHHATEQDVEAQWRSEMRLRNQCGVVEEERAAIRTLVDQRIQAVRR